MTLASWAFPCRISFGKDELRLIPDHPKMGNRAMMSAIR